MKHGGSAMKNAEQLCRDKARLAFLAAKPWTPFISWDLGLPSSLVQKTQLDDKPTPQSPLTH